MINGEFAVMNGKHTGKRNGVVLRKKGTEVIK
jgi:N-acyl-D-amino-acid deacylase